MYACALALAAFRMLMTLVYAHARSLLLGVLLHASFTGSQLLLWPAAGPREELVWYGGFAGALWGALGLVTIGVRRWGGGRARSRAFHSV
jgi:hypothetical protein